MAKFFNLGTSGLRVTPICLGTMSFSNSNEKVSKNSWGISTYPKDECHAMMDAYVALGGNFIDTANSYGPEESELCIGSWLQAKIAADKNFRSKIVIATKAFNSMGDSPNMRGLSRVHLIEAVDASLRRLGTSYIDLYQCHCWDELVQSEETLGALNDLVVSGKLRYIGISNFCGWQVQKYIELCKRYNWAPVVSAQMLYSLMDRTVEWEFQGILKREKITMLAWSPLSGGWLSGKYKKDIETAPAGSRAAWASSVGFQVGNISKSNNEQTWKIIAAVEALSEKYKCSMAALSLSWLMSKGSIPIIGVNNMAQLQSNMQALSVHLSAEDVKLLDDVSDIGLPYPYNMIADANK